jgi:hypothetical protein
MQQQGGGRGDEPEGRREDAVPTLDPQFPRCAAVRRRDPDPWDRHHCDVVATFLARGVGRLRLQLPQAGSANPFSGQSRSVVGGKVVAHLASAAPRPVKPGSEVSQSARTRRIRGRRSDPCARRSRGPHTVRERRGIAARPASCPRASARRPRCGSCPEGMPSFDVVDVSPAPWWASATGSCPHLRRGTGSRPRHGANSLRRGRLVSWHRRWTDSRGGDQARIHRRRGGPP